MSKNVMQLSFWVQVTSVTGILSSSIYFPMNFIISPCLQLNKIPLVCGMFSLAIYSLAAYLGRNNFLATVNRSAIIMGAKFKQRYAAWMDNASPRRHGFLNENLDARCRRSSMRSWSGMPQRPPKHQLWLLIVVYSQMARLGHNTL